MGLGLGRGLGLGNLGMHGVEEAACRGRRVKKGDCGAEVEGGAEAGGPLRGQSKVRSSTDRAETVEAGGRC